MDNNLNARHWIPICQLAGKKYSEITLKHTNSLGTTSVQLVYALGTNNGQSTLKTEIAPFKPILPV